MASTKVTTESIPSESAFIEGEDQIITPKEGSIVAYKPSEGILRVVKSTLTLEGGALETLASDKKVDVCKGSETSGSQLLVETSSLQIYEEVPLHQDVSGAEGTFNLSNLLSVGTQSTLPKLSETIQNSERLAPDQEKGEVERVRTLDVSSEIERVGAQPHCDGQTRHVTTFVDDVMNAGCFLPEVLLLLPPNRESYANFLVR